MLCSCDLLNHTIMFFTTCAHTASIFSYTCSHSIVYATQPVVMSTPYNATTSIYPVYKLLGRP